MLRQPDSETDHEQYAKYHYVTMLEKASPSVIFIAQIPHDLGELLGSVFVKYCSITDPLPTLEPPDCINEDVYKYVHVQVELQRLMEVDRNYFCMSSLQHV